MADSLKLSTEKSRYESIRLLVNDIAENASNKQETFAKLYGVSSFASMLAMKRGIDIEIAAIIGLLHNYYFYIIGVRYFPGINSAETVRQIIRDLNVFLKTNKLSF